MWADYLAGTYLRGEMTQLSQNTTYILSMLHWLESDEGTRDRIPERTTDLDELDWLMSWYAAQCDGSWEHGSGVKIETLDNPGWYLRIDLADTPLMDREFIPIAHDLESEVSWWSCKVENGQFVAACGARDLKSVVAVFRDWAVRTEVSDPPADGSG